MGQARKLSALISPIVVWAGLGVAYALYFLTHPQIDLEIHRNLWKPAEGFYMKDDWWVVILYELVPWITRSVVVGGALLLLANRVCKACACWKFGNREILFLLLALAIGPGLVTNVILKDNWGRARPSQIEEFGGAKQFTPPLVMADQCEKNCSFVSGHASVGFFLAAFALLLRTRWKRYALYTFALGLGLSIGFARMAMGGHFFSDVVFAGIFTLLVVHLLYLILFGPWRSPSNS